MVIHLLPCPTVKGYQLECSLWSTCRGVQAAGGPSDGHRGGKRDLDASAAGRSRAVRQEDGAQTPHALLLAWGFGPCHLEGRATWSEGSWPSTVRELSVRAGRAADAWDRRGSLTLPKLGSWGCGDTALAPRWGRWEEGGT